MHQQDVKKTPEENAALKNQKNATCCFVQILDVTTQKGAAFRLLDSNLLNQRLARSSEATESTDHTSADG